MGNKALADLADRMTADRASKLKALLAEYDDAEQAAFMEGLVIGAGMLDRLLTIGELGAQLPTILSQLGGQKG